MPKKNVDRRAFLKGAALAALAPAAQAAPGRPAAHKWDKEADVVVIGSGAAGLPAVHYRQGERRVGDPGRGQPRHRRPRRRLHRQHPAGRRHQRPRKRPELWIRPISSSKTSPTGPWWSPTAPPITASTTATSFALSPTTTFSPTTFSCPMDLLLRSRCPTMAA